MKKNEEYIVNIIDNGFQGEGIAKIDDVIVFIDGAIKGEKIKIKLVKVLSGFCYGKILEIIEGSENRREVECSTYKKCGGCDLRHIKYEETLEIKRSIVENCLYKALKREVKVMDVVGMDKPVFYRNKLQYPLGINDENKPVMGVFSSRTHDVIETKECFIQNEKCQQIANEVFEHIKQNNISIYNEKTLKGTVRHIIVRIGEKTKEIMVILVVNENDVGAHNCAQIKNWTKLSENITKKYPEIKTIIKNINNKNTNVIMGNKNEVIYGEGYIYDILGEYKFKISPNSFYQINPIQTEKLYNTAIEFATNKNKENIALDLYCGIGTIGIFASKQFKKIYGIEIVDEAVEDAKENARLNNINNIEFFTGNVGEDSISALIEEIKPNTVFVDPPRKGLDGNTIETLLKLEPEQIIYISCNPSTLARDIAKLEEKYELKQVSAADMFPWTKHIEIITSLQLEKGL